MTLRDSKALWLGLRARSPEYDVRLGVVSANRYVRDAKRMAFFASRYKFCARMLADLETVVEIGCGDAFCAPIVAQAVGELVCTDIDEETLEENRSSCAAFDNITFGYHDFRSQAYPRTVEGVFLVDVLEHIYPEEEAKFVTNLAASLGERGIAIFGTPNVTSEQHASAESKAGHVNLKSHDELRAMCSRYFHNVFMFGMNDEVLHTGYPPMAHYLWALCVAPIREPTD